MLEKFEKWSTLVKVTAWIFRFIKNCQEAVKNQSATKRIKIKLSAFDLNSLQLSNEELDFAKQFLFRVSQWSRFGSEIETRSIG